MDKFSKLFMNQVQLLQKQLENLLDKEPTLKHQAKPQTINPGEAFEASTDLSQIESIGLGLPGETLSRVETLFSRLSVYFDSGLLFRKDETLSWRAMGGFDQGEYFPLKGIEIEVPFRFPQMSLIEVRKVNSTDIFNHLQEIQVIKNDRSQALIFTPHPDFIFMVTSGLADPWLKPHIERIQKEVLTLLVDQF